MNIYFDTGILLKLYSAEADSRKAVALVQRYGSPIWFSDLQDAELRNALYRKCARSEISRQELRKALGHLQRDVDQGVLQAPSINWTDIFGEAKRLTAKYALVTQCRTLDTLHIAMALSLEVSSIGTTDERQRVLARKAGLKVIGY